MHLGWALPRSEHKKGKGSPASRSGHLGAAGDPEACEENLQAGVEAGGQGQDGVQLVLKGNP